MPSSRRSPQPRDQTQVFHIAGGFYLPSKSPGNPKNPGVECHFPLQGIFPTKRSNQHLLCLLNWQAIALSLAPPVKHLVHKVYLCITFYLFIYLFILASPFGIQDLPQPGVEPTSPALGAQSLNHWTTRETSLTILKLFTVENS